jgi:hypothetical protein
VYKILRVGFYWPSIFSYVYKEVSSCHQCQIFYGKRRLKPFPLNPILLELLHTRLGFIFPKVFPCLLVIISHYPISYILGENIPPGEYSLSVDTSV